MTLTSAGGELLQRLTDNHITTTDMKRWIICLLLAVACSPVESLAQGFDVAREAVILLATKKAKKTLEAEEKAQAMNTTGHIWTKEEIQATTAFQKEFSEYLDTISDAISIAAEIYGIYYEVKQTTKNIRAINEIIANSPTNALALALSTKRNKIYRDVTRNSLDIIMDIRKVCFGNSKMTEQERNKIISSIRPKLKKFNKQLQTMAMMMYYTTMADVLDEVLHRRIQIDHNDKKQIAASCHHDWKNIIKRVHKR